MRRRWKLGLLLGTLLAVAVVLLLPMPRMVLIGLLRGEPFWRGRPASYYREQVAAQLVARKEFLVNKWLRKFGVRPFGERSGTSALSEMSKDPEAGPVLRVLLRDPEPRVREWVVTELVRQAAFANGAVVLPDLTESLQDPSPVVRRAAAEWLWRTTRQPEVVVPALRAVVNDTTHRERAHAAAALGLVGPPAREAVPDLLELLKMPGSSERLVAAQALWRIDPEAQSFLPQFLEALRNEKENQDLLGVVRHLGPKARAVLPVLEELLRDPKMEKRLTEVVSALARIDPRHPLVLPTLARLLESGNDNDRQAVVSALARIDPRHPLVLPTLARLLESGNDNDRHAAITVMPTLGLQAREVVPFLVPVLRARDRTSVVAASALVKITPDHPEIMPWALTVLREGQSAERLQLLSVLRELGPRAQEAVPDLIDLLRQGPRTGRPQVAKTLAALGPAAKAAVPALQEALRKELGDDYTATNLRSNLTAALEKIDPTASVPPVVAPRRPVPLQGWLLLVAAAGVGALLVFRWKRRAQSAGRQGCPCQGK